MIVRSRAPFRIGFAGGGTDLESYYTKFGGDVFNATVSLYANCSIMPLDNGKVVFSAPDMGVDVEYDAAKSLELKEPLILHKGVYNRMVRDFNGGKPLSVKVSTAADVPSGSGLGTSSTMTVAIIEAFCRYLSVNLTTEEKAVLAYDIERKDIGLAGGKQDQYAACYGGFSHMQFKKDGSVIVNQMRLAPTTILELETSLYLFYSGKSHDSAKIISEQIKNASNKNEKTIKSMQHIQQAAIDLKDALVKSDFRHFAEILNKSWEEKKKTSSVISNPEIERIIEFVFSSGAEAVKLSGAGGGGFLLIYFDPLKREELSRALKKMNGLLLPVKFTKYGVESWSVKR